MKESYSGRGPGRVDSEAWSHSDDDDNYSRRRRSCLMSSTCSLISIPALQSAPSSHWHSAYQPDDSAIMAHYYYCYYYCYCYCYCYYYYYYYIVSKNFTLFIFVIPLSDFIRFC